METILHLLPLTGAQKAAFQAAAPESEHLFLPTNDRGGASSIPQEWRERTTILLGYVPPDQLKTFPNLKWVQSWNAGVDPYLVPGVLPEGVRLTSAVGAYGPAVSEHMLACSWPSISACPPTGTSRGPISGRILDPLAPWRAKPCWWPVPAISAATLPGWSAPWGHSGLLGCAGARAAR